MQDFTNLDGILRHLITLQNFALTLTNVTSGDKVVGIPCRSYGPITNPEIEDLFSGVIGTECPQWVHYGKLRGCRELPCRAHTAGSLDPHIS
ncbi:hypothetical protein Tco_0532666 [Tanacetum coccineum]